MNQSRSCPPLLALRTNKVVKKCQFTNHVGPTAETSTSFCARLWKWPILRFVILGIDSRIIGHIKSYKDQLNTWLSEAGYNAKYWKRCYQAWPNSFPTTSTDLINDCKHKGPTLTILRTNNYVFGGFTNTKCKWLNYVLLSDPSKTCTFLRGFRGINYKYVLGIKFWKHNEHVYQVFSGITNRCCFYEIFHWKSWGKRWTKRISSQPATSFTCHRLFGAHNATLYISSTRNNGQSKKT